MNAYPVKWVRIEQFCEMTGYTPDTVMRNRQRGIWPDGIITINRGRKVHVNLVEYDKWVAGNSRAA